MLEVVVLTQVGAKPEHVVRRLCGERLLDLGVRCEPHVCEKHRYKQHFIFFNHCETGPRLSRAPCVWCFLWLFEHAPTEQLVVDMIAVARHQRIVHADIDDADDFPLFCIGVANESDDDEADSAAAIEQRTTARFKRRVQRFTPHFAAQLDGGQREFTLALLDRTAEVRFLVSGTPSFDSSPCHQFDN